MFSTMENSESGDEGFIPDPQYMLNPDNDDVLEQDNNTDDSSHDQFKHVPLREQDRFLPIANIAKIMKKAIPDNGKIAKDARETIQECVSEFISFVTSEASDRCRFEKRKTINGEDILFAMTTLGFDNYVEPLKLYLQKYREITLSTPRVEKQGSSGTVLTDGCDDRYESTQVQLITDGGQPGDNTLYASYTNNIEAFTL